MLTSVLIAAALAGQAQGGPHLTVAPRASLLIFQDPVTGLKKTDQPLFDISEPEPSKSLVIMGPGWRKVLTLKLDPLDIVVEPGVTETEAARTFLQVVCHYAGGCKNLPEAGAIPNQR